MNKQHKREKKAYRSGLRRNHPARYPIEQSPLWQLDSLHRLCQLLRLTPEEFAAVSSAPTYHCFVDRSKPEKPRPIQEPIQDTMRLHYRVAKFLDSVKCPSFLHSARKNRSHVTNAEAHKGDHAIVTTDISDFYNSTSYAHVKAFFREDLDWPHDMARMLAKALTFEGHLPTGSAVSPILSYFTHRHLFASIEKLCTAAQAKVTLYVDDITLSGSGASKTLLSTIKGQIHRRGLRAHKDKLVPTGTPAIVTGAVVRGSTLRLRNKHHQKIIDLIAMVPAGLNTEQEKKLHGRLAAAKSVDRAAAASLQNKYRNALTSRG